MRPGLGGPVGAAVGAVTFVLHHHLHAVLAALRVSDHGRHITCTGSCRRDGNKTTVKTLTRCLCCVCVAVLPLQTVCQSHLLSSVTSVTSLTCSEDLKVGGLVCDVAHRFNSRAFDCNFGGVTQSFVHIHLKWTLGDLLACKQHRHLGHKNNRLDTTQHVTRLNTLIFYFLVPFKKTFLYHKI